MAPFHYHRKPENRQLLDLFRQNLPEIIRLFASYDLIELTNDEIIAHA